MGEGGSHVNKKGFVGGVGGVGGEGVVLTIMLAKAVRTPKRMYISTVGCNSLTLNKKKRAIDQND